MVGVVSSIPTGGATLFFAETFQKSFDVNTAQKYQKWQICVENENLEC